MGGETVELKLCKREDSCVASLPASFFVVVVVVPSHFIIHGKDRKLRCLVLCICDFLSYWNDASLHAKGWTFCCYKYGAKVFYRNGISGTLATLCKHVNASLTECSQPLYVAVLKCISANKTHKVTCFYEIIRHVTIK